VHPCQFFHTSASRIHQQPQSLLHESIICSNPTSSTYFPSLSRTAIITLQFMALTPPSSSRTDCRSDLGYYSIDVDSTPILAPVTPAGLAKIPLSPLDFVRVIEPCNSAVIEGATHIVLNLTESSLDSLQPCDSLTKRLCATSPNRPEPIPSPSCETKRTPDVQKADCPSNARRKRGRPLGGKNQPHHDIGTTRKRIRKANIDQACPEQENMKTKSKTCSKTHRVPDLRCSEADQVDRCDLNASTAQLEQSGAVEALRTIEASGALQENVESYDMLLCDLTQSEKEYFESFYGALEHSGIEQHPILQSPTMEIGSASDNIGCISSKQTEASTLLSLERAHFLNAPFDFGGRSPETQSTNLTCDLLNSFDEMALHQPSVWNLSGTASPYQPAIAAVRTTPDAVCQFGDFSSSICDLFSGAHRTNNTFPAAPFVTYDFNNSTPLICMSCNRLPSSSDEKMSYPRGAAVQLPYCGHVACCSCLTEWYDTKGTSDLSLTCSICDAFVCFLTPQTSLRRGLVMNMLSRVQAQPLTDCKEHSIIVKRQRVIGLLQRVVNIVTRQYRGDWWLQPEHVAPGTLLQRMEAYLNKCSPQLLTTPEQLSQNLILCAEKGPSPQMEERPENTWLRSQMLPLPPGHEPTMFAFSEPGLDRETFNWRNLIGWVVDILTLE